MERHHGTMVIGPPLSGKTTLVRILQRAAVDSTRSEATDGAARLTVDPSPATHAILMKLEAGDLIHRV